MDDLLIELGQSESVQLQFIRSVSERFPIGATRTASNSSQMDFSRKYCTRFRCVAGEEEFVSFDSTHLTAFDIIINFCTETHIRPRLRNANAVRQWRRYDRVRVYASEKSQCNLSSGRRGPSISFALWTAFAVRTFPCDRHRCFGSPSCHLSTDPTRLILAAHSSPHEYQFEYSDTHVTINLYQMHDERC